MQLYELDLLQRKIVESPLGRPMAAILSIPTSALWIDPSGTALDLNRLRARQLPTSK